MEKPGASRCIPGKAVVIVPAAGTGTVAFETVNARALAPGEGGQRTSGEKLTVLHLPDPDNDFTVTIRSTSASHLLLLLLLLFLIPLYIFLFFPAATVCYLLGQSRLLSLVPSRSTLYFLFVSYEPSFESTRTEFYGNFYHT